MKKMVALALLLAFGRSVSAQQLMTRNAYIGFFSKTPLEDIRAETTQANAVVDITKRTLAFAVLTKSFLFPKALMQEHFNENYVESDKFPKATFSGTYTGDVDTAKPGSYDVLVKGQLTLHGVTRPVDLPAVFVVEPGKLNASAQLNIKPQDFSIRVPALVRDKIAREINVDVRAAFPFLK